MKPIKTSFLALLGLVLAAVTLADEQTSIKLTSAELNRLQAWKPSRTPYNAIGACTIVSRKCQSADNFSGLQSPEGLELQTCKHTPKIKDVFNNIVRNGHFKSTYFVVNDNEGYNNDVFRMDDDDLTLKLIALAESQTECDADVRCYQLYQVDEDCYPLSPEAMLEREKSIRAEVEAENRYLTGKSDYHDYDHNPDQGYQTKHLDQASINTIQEAKRILVELQKVLQQIDEQTEEEHVRGDEQKKEDERNKGNAK